MWGAPMYGAAMSSAGSERKARVAGIASSRMRSYSLVGARGLSRSRWMGHPDHARCRRALRRSKFVAAAMKRTSPSEFGCPITDSATAPRSTITALHAASATETAPSSLAGSSRRCACRPGESCPRAVAADAELPDRGRACQGTLTPSRRERQISQSAARRPCRNDRDRRGRPPHSRCAPGRPSISGSSRSKWAA
jgi:hypothetical protein